MTTLIALSCNHCGAPLDVPSGTRFATCAHCGSRLAVSETGGAYVSAVLDELTVKTDRIYGELRAMQLREALVQLDAEWQAREARNDFPPAEFDIRVMTNTVVVGVAGVGAVALIVAAVSSMPLVETVMVSMVAAAGLLLFMANTEWQSRDRREAERDYRARRASLVRELQTAEVAGSQPVDGAPAVAVATDRSEASLPS